MYNLLNELNETAEALEIKEQLIEDNLNLLSGYEDIGYVGLNEAITNWIVKKMTALRNGTLPKEELKSTISIFGALNAIQNSDIADAFNERGDLGTTLAKVYSGDEQASQLSLNRLEQIGNHPSARTFTKQAEEAINSPNRMHDFARGIQVPIDRVMNKLLAQEKASSKQNPNPNGPRQTDPAEKPNPQQKPQQPQKDDTDINDWFV